MASFAEFFQLLTTNVWLYGGTFLLVLSLLVFVHEWGHYIVARLCGVRVDVFSIGFGKEIWGINDRNGTRWKFSMIPLGGYVKMFGDVDPASMKHAEVASDESGALRPLSAQEKAVAFYNKPVWQRAAIVFAGPAINFLFAIALLSGLYIAHGQPVTPPVGVAVIEGSAAESAGFRPHDVVLSINGKTIRRFDDIRREVMIALDTEMVFRVRRDEDIVTLRATPSVEQDTDRHGFRSSRGLLGLLGPGNGIDLKTVASVNGQTVSDPDSARAALSRTIGEDVRIGLVPPRSGADNRIIHAVLRAEHNPALVDTNQEPPHSIFLTEPARQEIVRFAPVEAVGAAILETANITTGTLQALGQMFTGTRSATELGGIIRIGAIAGDMAQLGIVALIAFTALLSINLGLINLFPIPMLDGGHLVFYLVEMLKGSPLSEKVQEYAFRLGLVILVGIMLFANINDIVQLMP